MHSILGISHFKLYLLLKDEKVQNRSLYTVVYASNTHSCKANIKLRKLQNCGTARHGVGRTSIPILKGKIFISI